LRYKALVKAAGLLGHVTRTVDLDDQVEACRRVFESDTRWTVVRGSDMEEGESEGLPVWSRHVGNPILESNINRRIDFARLRPVHGRHARPRTRRRRSSVARALQLSLAARLERGNRVPQSQSRSHLRGVRSPFQRPQHTESGPPRLLLPCGVRLSVLTRGSRQSDDRFIAQCRCADEGGSVRRPLGAMLRRPVRVPRLWPGEDLHAQPVGIEDEERVIVVDVTIHFGQVVDVRAVGNTALVCGVHLVATVDLKREVLDPKS
jgi:hypothetical protein